MKQWLERWGWFALLVAAGALLRVGFVSWHPVVAGDSLVYGDLARNILQHHVYGFTEVGRVRPTLIRLPGYPAFLAVCFWTFGVWNWMAVLWVQVVVDMVGWWILGRTAGRLWGKRVGLAVLGAGMLCPFVANYCAVPLTETLVMFCGVVSLWGLARWIASGGGWSGWLWVIAVGLAYGVMLRPDEALLGVAVVAGMLWFAWREAGRVSPAVDRKDRGLSTSLRSGLDDGFSRTPGVSGWQRFLPVLVMCVAMAVPFGLWGARNWRVFHVVQPLAPRFANDPGEANPSGFQRWYRTWAVDFKSTMDVYWNFDGSSVSIGDLPGRAMDNEAQRRVTMKLLGVYNDRGSSSPAIDEAFGKLADERIRAKPLRYFVWVPALKVVDMWTRPRTEFMALPLDWWNFRAHEKGSWECLGYAAWNGAYLVLAGVGLMVWRRRGWDVMLGVMVGFVVLRCALLWTIDNSEMRYTLECFPVLVMLVGVAVEKWCRGEEERSRRGR